MAGIKLAEWYLAACQKLGGNVSDMSNWEKNIGAPPCIHVCLILMNGDLVGVDGILLWP